MLVIYIYGYQVGNFCLMPSRRISKENHFLYLNFQKKKNVFRYSWAQPTFIPTAQFTGHHLKCSIVVLTFLDHLPSISLRFCVCFSIIFLETNHKVVVANYQSESVVYHRMTQLLALKVNLVQISEQVAAFTLPYSPNPFGCRESIGNRKKKKRFMRSIWLFGCYSCWLCLKNDAYFGPLLPPVFNEHRQDLSIHRIF